ncbi:MerR family transcriptional regulator [Acidovorax sp.]|uniref:MerR family transcriptional regulator n=1 Tax=Acidovorax sp. TaxID=1872122 RepID=UPI0027B99E36|nr:MerR family transcriptional regulator [Acidovorax sp.]
MRPAAATFAAPPPSARPRAAMAARAQRAPGPLHLSTQALCEAAGVSRGVLRLYEREGLVPPPVRSAAGYRQYPADEVLRLQAIRGLKELGFTLKEIALLLGEREAQTMDAARLQAMAQAQLIAIDTRIARLQMVRQHVATAASGDMSAIDDPECHFLMEFLSGGPATAPATSAAPKHPHNLTSPKE